MDGLQFEARPGRVLPLAISIGAAIFPHDGDSYEALLATADSRMYRDKTKRKRVLVTKLGADYVPSRRDATPAISEVELERAASGVL